MSNVIHTGHGHFVAKEKVASLTVLANSQSPMPAWRQIRAAEEAGRLIMHTSGKRPRSLLHLDSGYLVVSSVEASTLVKRWED